MPLGRVSMSHPSGWVDRPRSECDVPSARIKLTCPPCPKRVTRLARSDLLAPPEASYSPRSKRVVRLERGVPPNPERDSTPVPNETVPLSRTGQHLCPERGGTSDLSIYGGRAGGQVTCISFCSRFAFVKTVVGVYKNRHSK